MLLLTPSVTLMNIPSRLFHHNNLKTYLQTKAEETVPDSILLTSINFTIKYKT